MKPYGREKIIKGGKPWKVDYHIHKNSKKIGNWWEGMADYLSRTEIKRRVSNEIDKEITSDGM